jgi:hypothetical protein
MDAAMSKLSLYDAIALGFDSLVLARVESGVDVTENHLYNAVKYIDILVILIAHSKSVIEIQTGMVVDELMRDYAKNKEIVKFIIHNCNVAGYRELFNVLIKAIEEGDFDMVKFLLDGDYFGSEFSFEFAIVQSARYCHIDIIKYMYKKCNIPLDCIDRALESAIDNNAGKVSMRRGDLAKVISFLADNGATVKNTSIARWMYVNGDITILALLLSYCDVQTVVDNLWGNPTTIQEDTAIIEKAMAVNGAARNIAITLKKVYKAKRRLSLARVLYRNMGSYSPALANTIAIHGGL